MVADLLRIHRRIAPFVHMLELPRITRWITRPPIELDICQIEFDYMYDPDYCNHLCTLERYELELRRTPPSF